MRLGASVHTELIFLYEKTPQGPVRVAWAAHGQMQSHVRTQEDRCLQARKRLCQNPPPPTWPWVAVLHDCEDYLPASQASQAAVLGHSSPGWPENPRGGALQGVWRVRCSPFLPPKRTPWYPSTRQTFALWLVRRLKTKLEMKSNCNLEKE